MYYISGIDDNIYTVKDTSDGIEENLTLSDLCLATEKKLKIYGFNKDNNNCSVVDLKEYQSLDWGRYLIQSFFDNNTKKLSICIQNKETKCTEASFTFKGYLDAYGMEPQDKDDEFPNGTLGVIFEGGMEVGKTHCIGFYIWLDYKDDDDYYNKVIEIYLKYRDEDKKVTVEHYDGWNFDETSKEYFYNEEIDDIDYHY